MGVEGVGFCGLEGFVDFFSQKLPGLVELLEPPGSDAGDDFTDLEGEPFVDFFQRCPAAHEQIPDGYGQFAGHGTHRQVQRAFAPEEFLSPPGQRMLGAENGLGRFDQQAAQTLLIREPDFGTGSRAAFRRPRANRLRSGVRPSSA